MISFSMLLKRTVTSSCISQPGVSWELASENARVRKVRKEHIRLKGQNTARQKGMLSLTFLWMRERITERKLSGHTGQQAGYS
ncbi:uncharacterized protein LOC124795221 isoform X2 [Schistocerca piceifrons]|uniref:uncharacterized protein LOC124795221 isoform X2 n=1 Tax=Schistocerca piceifrons TaxID=274613 RepID=UPI001F5F5362|nr:uncharacterized protein LOC124795221 isoform X2 [Schistocerca piceifrons]